MQTLSQYFLKRGAVAYFISLACCCLFFLGNTMPWYGLIAGIVEILLFCFLAPYWEVAWRNTDSRTFEKRVFGAALLFRLAWLFLYYFFTMAVWHTPWEQPIGTTMDSTGYFEEALWVDDLIRSNEVSAYIEYVRNGSISDAGYPVFLALWNLITGGSILFSRLPNVFFDAWTVILSYRLAKRNFDEKSARLAALFVTLMPMLIFYTGITMKESLMLMLSMWALERGDYIIRSRRFALWPLVGFGVLALSVTLFRTALAWVIVLSFLCGVVASSERIINKTRRFQIIIFVGLAGVLLFGGTVLTQLDELLGQYDSTGQNFEYRATRQGGNKLVKNLSKSVLFPILFTGPFPTMVTIEGQNVQQIQNGGYFIKNVLSFFVILAIVLLFLHKKWRGSVMILAYMLGYLVVLGLSSFAQSGRFHHPVIAAEMVVAAYGINLVKTRKMATWYDYFLVIECLIVIAWNAFKLKGRGLL